MDGREQYAKQLRIYRVEGERLIDFDPRRRIEESFAVSARIIDQTAIFYSSARLVLAETRSKINGMDERVAPPPAVDARLTIIGDSSREIRSTPSIGAPHLLSRGDPRRSGIDLCGPPPPLPPYSPPPPSPRSSSPHLIAPPFLFIRTRFLFSRQRNSLGRVSKIENTPVDAIP